MFSGRIVCCRDALDFLTNPRFGRAVFDDLMKRRGLPMSPMSCSLTAFCYWSDTSLSIVYSICAINDDSHFSSHAAALDYDYPERGALASSYKLGHSFLVSRGQ